METAPLSQAEARSLIKAGASPARTSANPARLYRRSMKTQIEKRRRARINASLEQLKKLLQQASDQQDTKAKSHLEKAEVLERTVQELRLLKQQGVVAASPSQDEQHFVAGYCHCLKTVRIFLASAGSSVSQGTRSQILRHLEETSGPVPKDWKPYKPASLSRAQSVFPWSSPPLEPTVMSSSDSYTFAVQSWLPLSLMSRLLPQRHVACIQPGSPVAPTYLWRPW